MIQPMRIGGELRDSGAVEPITTPYDGEIVGEVRVGSDADMDDAIAAADRAFAATRRMPTHERVAILRATASAIGARADELAELMTRESGKPIRFSRGEVARGLDRSPLSNPRDAGGRPDSRWQGAPTTRIRRTSEEAQRRQRGSGWLPASRGLFNGS